jgi:hypothetical protein
MARPVMVASPVSGTICASLVAHSTWCTLRSTGLPSLSVTRYGSFTDCETLMASESLSNETSRTLGRTVTAVASLAPCDVTVTVVRPDLSANSTPFCVTMATFGSELVHDTAGATPPDAEGRIALSCTDWSTSTVSAFRDSATCEALVPLVPKLGALGAFSPQPAATSDSATKKVAPLRAWRRMYPPGLVRRPDWHSDSTSP